MFVALRDRGIIFFRMHEKLLTSAFNPIEKRFSPGGLKVDYFYSGGFSISLIMPKMFDYLQISQIPQCSIYNPKGDSELRKRFFRKFKHFLAPGLKVRKSRISQDTTDF